MALGWCMWLTADAGAATCPSCGVVSRSVKERTVTSPKDIPYGENGILVRWCKTRWRCQQASCEVGSFTESIPEVPPRARTTRRLRAQIGSAIGDAARSVSEVAAAHRVSWPTAHRAFIEHAEARLVEPEPVRVLGIDETRRGRPRWEYCIERSGGCGWIRGTPVSLIWTAPRDPSTDCPPLVTCVRPKAITAQVVTIPGFVADRAAADTLGFAQSGSSSPIDSTSTGVGGVREHHVLRCGPLSQSRGLGRLGWCRWWWGWGVRAPRRCGCRTNSTSRVVLLVGGKAGVGAGPVWIWPWRGRSSAVGGGVGGSGRQTVGAGRAETVGSASAAVSRWLVTTVG